MDVLMTVDAAIRKPPVSCSSFVAVGAPPPLLAQEAQRGDRLQPGKPGRRIRDECQFSLVWTDDEVGPISDVFDQREDGTRPTFRRMHSRGFERLVWLAPLLTCW